MSCTTVPAQVPAASFVALNLVQEELPFAGQRVPRHGGQDEVGRGEMAEVLPIEDIELGFGKI